jgi:hypothetical protein
MNLILFKAPTWGRIYKIKHNVNHLWELQQKSCVFVGSVYVYIYIFELSLDFYILEYQ